MKYWIRVICQIALLWVIYELGKYIIGLTHLPIPGNVGGMMLLFILLVTRIIPLRFLEDGADLLLKHLSLFFIPIAVGTMELGSLLQTYGLQLAAVILLGSALGILVTGTLAQIFTQRAVKEEGQ